jgi:endonuclease/exonuclease/phosphatase family metal-dependent hydrolase
MDSIVSGEYASRWGALCPQRELRVLTWNINRGLRLPEIVDFVGREKPDLCIFQEVDLHARRTGKTDVANFVASRFRYNYVLGIEFEELGQGTTRERAFQGQAVFTRSRIVNSRILRFRRQSDFWQPRWFLPRWSALQRRRGGRMALVVEIAIGRTKLVVYNVHLESQADDGLRLSQLVEVLEDSMAYSRDTPVIIAGDLNTRKAPSPLQRYLLSAGFHDGFEKCGRRATKPNGETLDWIFTRGSIVCSKTRVHQNITSSDHYPVSTTVY